jgi:hypothetical protein
MTSAHGADSTTLAASVEPGPDVRLDDERQGHSAASQAVASLNTPNRVWGRRDLVWRRDGNGWVICHHRSPLLRVARDTQFRNMWRIAHAGDRLSDLTNLTRARDGAASRALAILNRPCMAQETRHEWPPVGETELAATPVAPAGSASPRASHGVGSPTRLSPDVQPPRERR